MVFVEIQRVVRNINRRLYFRKRGGFVPVYLRQTTNDLTGEHSCIMLNVLKPDDAAVEQPEDWLMAYWVDFRRRFISLLSYQFRAFTPSIALGVLISKSRKIPHRSEFKG